MGEIFRCFLVRVCYKMFGGRGHMLRCRDKYDFFASAVVHYRWLKYKRTTV